MIFSVYLPTIWSEGFGLFEEVEVQILLFNMPLFVFMKWEDCVHNYYTRISLIPFNTWVLLSTFYTRTSHFFMSKRISRPMWSLLTFDEVCLEHTFFFFLNHNFKQWRKTSNYFENLRMLKGNAHLKKRKNIGHNAHNEDNGFFLHL